MSVAAPAMIMSARQRRLLLAAFVCGLGGAPMAASAQSARPPHPAGPAAPATQASVASQQAERQRLRGELDRVHAEIDRLKKGDRGLRDDYRLRARMADAEALARRLTEIDARLQRQPAPPSDGAAPAMAPRLGAEPGAAPTDGPAELEAKADILADQARRVQGQAVALKARIEQVRARMELRSRARQLERDPFAPLEGSRRRSVNGATQAESAPRSSSQTTITGFGPQAPSKELPPNDQIPPGGNAASSVYLRGLLDSGTLAEIRRLEANGSPTSNLEAMERALSALEGKARHLDAQSKALRQKAKR